VRAVALETPVGEELLALGVGVVAVKVRDGELLAGLHGAGGVGDVGEVVHAV